MNWSAVNRTISEMGFAVLLLLGLAATTHGQVKVTIDHNTGSGATTNFKFRSVPTPARDDAALRAKLMLVDGQIDGGSADLGALVDGVLPSAEDEPGANLFFRAGSMGGRLRIDLGSVIEVQQINTYSWHPSSRGPQLYKVYAADGAEPKFNADPKRPGDPVTFGWTLVATVNTLPQAGDDGGQFGVSITDPSGGLGKYRYLLFDIYPTELSDDWGNTFYSEIDVVAKRLVTKDREGTGKWFVGFHEVSTGTR